jgi:hypothetical protein
MRLLQARNAGVLGGAKRIALTLHLAFRARATDAFLAHRRAVPAGEGPTREQTAKVPGRDSHLGIA